VGGGLLGAVASPGPCAPAAPGGALPTTPPAGGVNVSDIAIASCGAGRVAECTLPNAAVGARLGGAAGFCLTLACAFRDAGSSGTAQLGFSGSGGAAVAVANLSALVYAELPTPAASLAGVVAAPVFWNVTEGAYSSAGLVAIPNPAPAAAVLDWVAGFAATTDDALPLAWDLSLDGCEGASLDCGNAANRSSAIALCPSAPRAGAAVKCGAQRSGIIRAWVGCGCPLWNASSGCSWNVSTQSFAGGACVLANVTRIGTRHLTAFAVQTGPPEIKTLSASDLVSISPQDLVHIKGILIVVCVLFAGMHFFSLLLSKMDQRDYDRLHSIAFSGRMGHAAVSVDKERQLWTWRFTFTQEVVDADKLGEQALCAGSAVQFARLIGVPFIRLACAVPETMLGGLPPRAALGHYEGMCPTRFDKVQSELSCKEPLSRNAPRSLHALIDVEDAVKAPVDPHALASINSDPACELTDPITLASTAFMHALLVSWSLESSDEVVRQQRLFISQLPPAEAEPLARRFLHLYTAFKELLISGPGSLRSQVNWFNTARKWRVILLSTREGFWEPDAPLAFALLANNRPQPRCRLQGVQLVVSIFSDTIASVMGSVAGGGAACDPQVFVSCVIALAGAAKAARSLFFKQKVAKPGDPNAPASVLNQRYGMVGEEGHHAATHQSTPHTSVLNPQHGMMGTQVPGVISTGSVMSALDGSQTHDALQLVVDLDEELSEDEDEPATSSADPLASSAAALLAVMPAELREACGGDEKLCGRIWATSLVAAFLRSSPTQCWRVDSENTPLSQQRTLLDQAEDWVEAAAASLEPASQPGGLQRVIRLRAERALVKWQRLHERRIGASRAACVGTAEHRQSLGDRATATVLTSVLNNHPTFSLFTAPFSYGFIRWSGMYILVSALMSMLVVNIWFYWSKGSVCCDQVVSLLGCASAEMCLGFAGNCGDLATSAQAAAVFAGMPDGPYISGGSFVCTAFPADGSARDSFLSGLIGFAVSLPVAVRAVLPASCRRR